MTYHNTKEVTRFRVRIRPRSEMSTIVNIPLFNLISITQQHGVGTLIRLNPHFVKDCHVVGSIGVEGDTTEAVRYDLNSMCEHYVSNRRKYRHRYIKLEINGTKTLILPHRLALSTIHTTTLVQSRKLCIRLRFHFHSRYKFGCAPS